MWAKSANYKVLHIISETISLIKQYSVICNILSCHMINNAQLLLGVRAGEVQYRLKNLDQNPEYMNIILLKMT